MFMSAEMTVYLPAALLLIVLSIVVFVAVKRSRRAFTARVRAAYGSIPQGNKDDIAPMRAYHGYAAEEAGEGETFIDDTTWNDLNMDDVFLRVNICHTSIGDECLYHALHTLHGTKKQEKLIAWLDANESERLSLQKRLIGIGKSENNRLSAYLFHADVREMPHAWLYAVMALLPLVGIACFVFSSAIGLAVLLGSLAANIVTYYIKRLSLESELDSMRYFASMLYGAKKLQKLHGKTLEAFGVDLETPLGPFRRLGGMIPGTAKQTMAEFEALVIIFKSIFLIDLIRYNHILRVMKKHASSLRALFEAIGGLDRAVCVASFRKSLPYWCAPEFVEENIFRFDEVYHPLLKNPVSNSGDIENDSIITGSNASGKSTFIKTLAVNHILAQTLHTCCARRYALCPCHVATSMALRDDILSGDSYFITEIKSLKRLIDVCQRRRCVCFIDEILRGTNTPERIASSVAVLNMLHTTDSLVMVASHDIELTEILADTYDNYHFCETIQGGKITFDYTLKQGASDTANAIALLEYMGFDKQIVESARRIITQGK